LIFFLFEDDQVKRCKRKSKRKTEKKFTRRAILDWILIACSPATAPEKGAC
jgi:hypothetical protein